MELNAPFAGSGVLAERGFDHRRKGRRDFHAVILSRRGGVRKEAALPQPASGSATALACKANETLISLSQSRQVRDGSAKMSVATAPLYGQTVVWSKGKP